MTLPGRPSVRVTMSLAANVPVALPVSVVVALAPSATVMMLSPVMGSSVRAVLSASGLLPKV